MNPQELLAEVVEQLRGGWRFRWWAAGIAWAISIGGWLYVASMPDIYQASARVYVDTNSLLKPLMAGLTAQQNTLNEVQLVSTAVRTRPNLEAVARQTDLDLRARTPEEFEQLITSLQNRIRVMGGYDNIFTIQYEDSDRDKARDVVAAVLDTFVEDAIGAQGDDAELTEWALASEIKEHEQRLQTAEVALANFKKENIGYMPGESGDYYVRLQTALANVGATRERLRLLRERRDELSRQIGGEEPVFGIVPSTTANTSCSQHTNITALRAQLAQLLVEFTEKHPRVLTLEESIATLEERCARESAVAAATNTRQGTTLETNPVYQNLRLQLSNADVDIAEVRGQLQSYESVVEGLRRDVDKIAEVETQLKQLNRDYDVVQARHQELLRRWEDLQAKKRLDPVTDNVQFRRIEPPFALVDPIGPNRPMLLAAVLVFALGAGAGIAFVLNQVYPVYSSRRSVRRVSGLPVLGSISMLLTPEAAFRRRLAAGAWAASVLALIGSTVLLIGFSASTMTFLRTLSGAVL